MSVWDNTCEHGFQALKERVTSAPMLACADFKKSSILKVDASHGGLGAVLSQGRDGKVHLVAFTSSFKT